MNSSGRQQPAASGYTDAVRRLRPILLGALVFSALVNVLMLTGSIYMLQIYDRVLASSSIPTLLGLFAIVVVLYGFLGVYDFMRGRLLSRASLRLDRDLGARAFAQCPRTSQTLIDLDTVRGVLSGPATIALLDLPFVPIFVALLFFLHPWLGWLTLAGAGVACTLALIARALTYRAVKSAGDSERHAKALETASSRASETVAALGLIGPLGTRWREYRDAQLAALQSGKDPADLLSSASRSFRMLLQSAILSLGAYLVILGDISAGMIIASSILSGRALAPIDQITSHAPSLVRCRAAHHRLTDALSRDEEPPVIVLPRPKGRISVEHLVKYLPDLGMPRKREERPRILSQISFELEAGDVLGIVGASGSGKSTLARMLVGALEADGGTIRIDGATLDQWTPAQLGSFVGYLPQDVEMLPGTIRDNIARFDPEATDRDIIDATQLAGVHEIILRLPMGYASRIEDIVLSGGQMQRIGLARAVFGKPAIVVLDEPNSNLDIEGEAALAHTVKTLSRQGTTVVIVAHRTEALQAMTKLLALDDGKLHAFGPVHDVLAKHPSNDDTSFTSVRPRRAAASVSSSKDGFRAASEGAKLRPTRFVKSRGSASRLQVLDQKVAQR